MFLTPISPCYCNVLRLSSVGLSQQTPDWRKGDVPRRYRSAGSARLVPAEEEERRGRGREDHVSVVYYPSLLLTIRSPGI